MITNTTIYNTTSTVHGIIINTYEPLTNQLIYAVIGFIPLVIMLYLFFRTDFFPNLFEKIYEGLGKPKYTSEYNCRCARCQFELRTKRGLRKWKKTHKYNKEDLI